MFGDIGNTFNTIWACWYQQRRLAAEPLDDPTNQIDKVYEDSGAGYNPASSIDATIAERNPDMVIGLIPCVMGGSSIFELLGSRLHE